MVAANRTVGGLEILAPAAPTHDGVLSPPALELVADLARRFGGRVEELLARRRERQAAGGATSRGGKKYGRLIPFQGCAGIFQVMTNRTDRHPKRSFGASAITGRV